MIIDASSWFWPAARATAAWPQAELLQGGFDARFLPAEMRISDWAFAGVDADADITQAPTYDCPPLAAAKPRPVTRPR